jgi:predicted transposase YbfD/YdcC
LAQTSVVACRNEISAIRVDLVARAKVVEIDAMGCQRPLPQRWWIGKLITALVLQAELGSCTPAKSPFFAFPGRPPVT